mgnify:CR=1 FL=1|tara:strand:- start:744 stop:1964 length:1221 start_codon:yes stop_codon:yes gene_type:complete
MQLVSKNKRSNFLLIMLLIILVTSLTNPIIFSFSDGLSLRLSSFIFLLALFLSVLKNVNNSAVLSNAALSKLIPLFFITLILSLYFTFDDYNYRKFSGLIAYFYFFVFVFIMSGEKISLEKAQFFFGSALVIVIASMYIIELATIAKLRSSPLQSALFYVFPFQLLYYNFFSKKQLLDKGVLVFSILATVYALSFDFQKSAFIYIFSTLCLIFWITSKKIKLSRKILWLTLICILVSFGYDFVWQSFSNEIFDRDYSVINSSRDVDALDSSLYRFYVYQYAFDSVTSDIFHFLFGYGPGYFATVHDGKTPHSSLLYLLMSFGIFGFLSYYLLIFLSLRRLLKGLSLDNYSRLSGFLIVFILSGSIYSLFNNINGLSWEEFSFTTNILYFIAILIPFNLYEVKNDRR